MSHSFFVGMSSDLDKEMTVIAWNISPSGWFTRMQQRGRTDLRFFSRWIGIVLENIAAEVVVFYHRGDHLLHVVRTDEEDLLRA